MAKKRATTSTTRNWRPSRYNPAYTDFVIRPTIEEADLIQNAAEAEAARLGKPASRNNFCVRAILGAAKKELARNGR